MPIIAFGAGKIDKKMLTFLELPTLTLQALC
jgi:hypothetical protein